MTCRSCRRAARRKGARRAHWCARWIDGRVASFACACPCNAPSPSYVPPVMALPYDEDDG